MTNTRSLLEQAKARARQARNAALSRMYGGSNEKSNDNRVQQIREAVQRAREAALKRAKQFGGNVNKNRKSLVGGNGDDNDRVQKIREAVQRAREAALKRARQLGGTEMRQYGGNEDKNIQKIREAVRHARESALEKARQLGGGLSRARSSSPNRKQLGGTCGLANRDLLGGAKVKKVAKKLAAKRSVSPKRSVKRSVSPKRSVKKSVKKLVKRPVKRSTSPKHKISKKAMKKAVKKVKRTIKKTTKPKNASDRTYVAYICKGNGAKRLLTSPVGDKSKIYFHGLPSAAARKVLTALTKKRNVSNTRSTSIYNKNSLTGSKNAVRICLHEVTKGLHNVEGDKFQYEYFGWNQKCTGKPITLSHKDSRGRKVTNTFTPKFKHMVVRVTEKAKTLQAALAKARTKAARAKKSFAKSRKTTRRVTRK